MTLTNHRIVRRVEGLFLPADPIEARSALVSVRISESLVASRPETWSASALAAAKVLKEDRFLTQS